MAQNLYKHWQLLLVFCLLIVGCQTQTKKTMDIGDPDSQLLQALIQEPDFSNEWLWISSHLQQEIVSPNEVNHQLTEQATHILHGLYKSDNTYITVMHRIQQFEEGVQWVESFEFDNIDGVEMSQEIKINISPHGSYSKSKCVRELQTNSLPTTICQIKTGYRFVTSDLTLYAPGDINDEFLEMLIDKILSLVDDRVEQFDFPMEN